MIAEVEWKLFTAYSALLLSALFVRSLSCVDAISNSLNYSLPIVAGSHASLRVRIVQMTMNLS